MVSFPDPTLFLLIERVGSGVWGRDQRHHPICSDSELSSAASSPTEVIFVFTIMASNIDPSKLDLYEILGVSAGATSKEIEKAYKKRAREYHPDKTGTDETEEYMKRLNKAKDTLLSEELRADYDEKLDNDEERSFDAAGFLLEGRRMLELLAMLARGQLELLTRW